MKKLFKDFFWRKKFKQHFEYFFGKKSKQKFDQTAKKNLEKFLIVKIQSEFNVFYCNSSLTKCRIIVWLISNFNAECHCQDHVNYQV